MFSMALFSSEEAVFVGLRQKHPNNNLSFCERWISIMHAFWNLLFWLILVTRWDIEFVGRAIPHTKLLSRLVWWYINPFIARSWIVLSDPFFGLISHKAMTWSFLCSTICSSSGFFEGVNWSVLMYNILS